MKGQIMKSLLAILVMFGISIGWAAEKPALPQTASITGKVLEVKDVESYTYLRLKTKDGETWAAVARTPVKKDAEVTIENAMVMNNFESKSLKKTFDKIVFGTLGGAGAGAAGAGGDMAAMHSGVVKAPDLKDVKVPKASGPDARTVSEIVTKRAELKDRTVLVRGKVVKYTPEVLGKNWIHLRDGSGSASDNTDDVLVTTKDQARIGDVVVVKGIVHTDRDLGAGYSYKVLVEEATLQK
jgi:hypothetical protein